MADKLRSIYVDEMIDDWFSLGLPISRHGLHFLTERSLGSKYYGSEGYEFLMEHFLGNIHTNLKKLSDTEEDQFIRFASRHRKMWEAFRNYIIWLLENEYELSDVIRSVNISMLEGYEPNYPKAVGAAVAGRDGRYYERDTLIALTIEIWRDKYGKMPIKNNYKKKAEDQLTICSILYTALDKMKTKGETTPQPDAIYKIYLKARKRIAMPYTEEAVTKKYVKRFGKEPNLPRGFAHDAIDMMLKAIKTNKPLKFDWDDLDPDEYKL